jgi:nucleoside-diphosphate-sugar epimerase
MSTSQSATVEGDAARRFVSMAKVLVTGASGFIGSKLVARLVAAGDEVSCLVRNPQRGLPT